jgi:hypothetical protein
MSLCFELGDGHELELTTTGGNPRPHLLTLPRGVTKNRTGRDPRYDLPATVSGVPLLLTHPRFVARQFKHYRLQVTPSAER